MRVKICGITNLEDAIDAINAGCDALGFVFYEKSPRYIKPLKAKEIVQQLPPFVQTVGLFVNENEDFINQTCKVANMQLAQIIDDNKTLNYDLLDTKSIEVVRVKSKKDLENLDDKYYLVDAFVEGFGGSGQRLALEWFENIDCSKLIIAGGLKAENLRDLDNKGFYGVDVSSGVEEYKGKKDKNKMINFIKEANEIK